MKNIFKKEEIRRKMAAIAEPEQLELTYFNGRGLAETSRILLHLAGQPFKDTRYPLKIIDFSKLKFEREAFDKDKSSGKLKASLGKVPFLRTRGVVIPQSKAIERYLSRRFGFMGKTEEEGAQIDAFCEHIRDIKNEYQVPRKMSEGMAKTEALQNFFGKTLKDRLFLIEESLSATSSKFVIGKNVSLADVALFGLVEFFDNKEGILKALPEGLKGKYFNFLSSSRLKLYLSNREETPF